MSNKFGLFRDIAKLAIEDNDDIEVEQEGYSHSSTETPSESDSVLVSSSQSKKKRKKKRKDPDELLNERRKNLGIDPNRSPFRFPDSGIHLDNISLDAGTNSTLENAPPPPEYTYFNPEKIDWESVEEDDHDPDDDSYCHDCDNEQSEEQREVNPLVLQYRQHYEQGVSSVEPVRLAGQIQRLYNLNIRKYTPGKRYYTKKMIHEHFNYHVFIPAVIRVCELKNLNLGMKIIRERGLFRTDQEGNKCLEDKYWKNYFSMMTKRDVLLEKVCNDVSKKK